MDRTVRMRWLKGMYLANVIISGPIGLANLVAPDVMRTLMDIPPGDPIHFGIGAGALPLAFGIGGALGLRVPHRMAPVLLVQALYKSLFLVGGILPQALRGSVPGFAIPLIGLFTLFIVGDVIAIPFSHLFERMPRQDLAEP